MHIPVPRDVLNKESCLSHCHYFHASQDFREFYSTAIYPGLNCTLRNAKQVNDFLIAQFLNIPQNDAGPEIGRKFIDARLNLLTQFSSFHLLLNGVGARMQVITMIREVVGVVIVRGPLSLTVIINDQVTRQPH
jgi:hypothetical protein